MKEAFLQLLASSDNDKNKKGNISVSDMLQHISCIFLQLENIFPLLNIILFFGNIYRVCYFTLPHTGGI